MDDLWTALIKPALAALAIVVTLVLLYSVVLLARIARGMGDLRDRLDDLKLRLGVLDPGDTRVNPFTQSTTSSPVKTPPPNAPDETLPGNG